MKKERQPWRGKEKGTRSSQVTVSALLPYLNNYLPSSRYCRYYTHYAIWSCHRPAKPSCCTCTCTCRYLVIPPLNCRVIHHLHHSKVVIINFLVGSIRYLHFHCLPEYPLEVLSTQQAPNYIPSSCLDYQLQPTATSYQVVTKRKQKRRICRVDESKPISDYRGGFSA